MDKKTKTTPKNGEKAMKETEQELDIVAKAKANKKLITWTLVFILAVVIAILVFMFVNRRGAARADNAIGEADNVELNDSVALSLYENVATMGHDAGNRAKVEAAIILYRQNKYSEALQYLDDASISDPVVETGVYCLKGDCYVNLQDYDKALKAFKKALDIADDNPQLSPVIMVKMANIYREQGDKAKEAEMFKKIVDKYPSFGEQTYMDYNKYVERATPDKAE